MKKVRHLIVSRNGERLLKRRQRKKSEFSRQIMGENTLQKTSKHIFENKGSATKSLHPTHQHRVEKLSGYIRLFNRARAIMSENKFPPKLWGECVRTAAYLRDCTPTRTLRDKTPYEAYYGTCPDLSHLREI